MRILQHYRERASGLCGKAFLDAHEAFLRDLLHMEYDPLDELGADERAMYANFLSQCQRRYLAIRETEANEALIAVADGTARLVIDNLSAGFAREAYERVRDLKELIDFDACCHVVMVGSGAFPATLYWLRDHFPEIRYTGLDVDTKCVEMATRLTEALDIDNMQFEAVNGCLYDFDGADFVYVANQVEGKRAVLEQVVRSASVAQIVVREPTRRGELLAESVCDDLPSGLAPGKEGIESATFLSYDLLLRRQ